MISHQFQPISTKLTLDETRLVDATSIREDHVVLIQQKAERDGRPDLVRMCVAALSPQATDMRAIARAGCVELWNDQVGENHRPPGDEMRDNHAPLALELLEFPCPICHRKILGQDAQGVIRVPWHRIDVPVFPFGYAGPMYRIECPASLMVISQICDGEHESPRCDDPQCWLSEPTEQDNSHDEIHDDDQDPPTRSGNEGKTSPGAQGAQTWDEKERTSQAQTYDVQMRRMMGAHG